MTTALFINGIYESVLNEIIVSQELRGGGLNYIQPYKGFVIAMLKANPPSANNPIRLYVSTTVNLNNVCYIADIVQWEDKRALSPERRLAVSEHLSAFQQGESGLFNGTQEAGGDGVNLITIRNLERLDSFISTSVLTKTSDDLPLKKRSRSGGWSEVYFLGHLLTLTTQTQEQVDRDLATRIKESLSLSDEARNSRLAVASKIPAKFQIISVGFRRCADVIVAVLARAGGVCDNCKRTAPFLRRSDGTPYLEVHHWLPLSKGGEDCVENAGALCPNCHREFHHA